MTDNFEKRKQSFQNKYAYEEELHFKNKVGATHNLGAWASKIFGFDEQTTHDYIENLVQNRLVTGGVSSVIDAVANDFNEFGFSEDKKSVEHKMQLYLEQLDEEDGINH